MKPLYQENSYRECADQSIDYTPSQIIGEAMMHAGHELMMKENQMLLDIVLSITFFVHQDGRLSTTISNPGVKLEEPSEKWLRSHMHEVIDAMFDQGGVNVPDDIDMEKIKKVVPN